MKNFNQIFSTLCIGALMVTFLNLGNVAQAAYITDYITEDDVDIEATTANSILVWDDVNSKWIENIYFTSDVTNGDTSVGGNLTVTGTIGRDTFDFSEDNVLTDDATVYASLDALDLKWGDLASDANDEGASLVAVETGGNFTATTVQGALDELYTSVSTSTLAGLTDTTITTATANQILVLTDPNGTPGDGDEIWVNSNDLSLPGSLTVTGISTFNGDITATGVNFASDDVTITGGTIDNTVIGGTTPVAGTFTTLTGDNVVVNTDLALGGATISDILLDADTWTASDTNLATTNAVENYVESVVGAGVPTTANANEILVWDTDTSAWVATPDWTVPNAGGVRSGETANNTALFSAYDTTVGEEGYQTFATLTSGEEPSFSITGATITGGTMDNTVIGGTTATAGTFTNLTANTDFTLAGDTVNQILISTDAWTASDDAIPTTSSVDVAITAAIGDMNSLEELTDTTITTATANQILVLTDPNGTPGDGDEIWVNSSDLTLPGNLTVTGTTELNNTVTVGTGVTFNADTVSITGGTIDNTVIGGTTPVAGTFTTLTGDNVVVNTDLLLGGTTINDILNSTDDTWAASDTSLATTQVLQDYVESVVGAGVPTTATLNDTLYWSDNGTAGDTTDDRWVASSAFTNDGTNIATTGNLDVDGTITAGTGDTQITDATGNLQQTFTFTVDGVLTDNATVYDSLSALNDQWIDLGTSDTASVGANLIGIEDALGLFTATTVEGALAELKTSSFVPVHFSAAAEPWAPTEENGVFVANGATATVTIPATACDAAADVGRTITVKDGDGTARTANITVSAETGTIDGGTYILTENYNAIDMVCTAVGAWMVK